MYRWNLYIYILYRRISSSMHRTVLGQQRGQTEGAGVVVNRLCRYIVDVHRYLYIDCVSISPNALQNLQ